MAYLYALPDFNYVAHLTKTLTEKEEMPFGEYWAILALAKVLAQRGNSSIPKSVIQAFSRYTEKLPSRSDRKYEAKKILREFDYVETISDL